MRVTQHYTLGQIYVPWLALLFYYVYGCSEFYTMKKIMSILPLKTRRTSVTKIWLIFIRYNFRIFYEELMIILLPTKRDEIEFGRKGKMYNLTQLKTLKFRALFETSFHYLQKPILKNIIVNHQYKLWKCRILQHNVIVIEAPRILGSMFMLTGNFPDA